jgi:predicted Zn-dependent protease
MKLPTYTQKHLLRLFDSQARNLFKSYIALLVAILAARSNPQVASGAIAAANASQFKILLISLVKMKKKQIELGMEILINAGFDPKGFIDFFQTIEKFNEFSLGSSPSFFKDTSYYRRKN